MQHVEVDDRKSQPVERLGEVPCQGIRVDARRRRIRVATLGQDEDVVGETAALEPGADGPFRGAAAVDVAGVNGADAVLEGSVEQRVGGVLRGEVVAAEDHRAEDETREVTGRLVLGKEVPAFGRRVLLVAFDGSGSEDPRTRSKVVAVVGTPLLLRVGCGSEDPRNLSVVVAGTGAWPPGHGAVGPGSDADARFEGVLDTDEAPHLVHHFEQRNGLGVRQQEALDVALAQHSFDFERLVLVAVAAERALHRAGLGSLALQREGPGAPEILNQDPPAAALDDGGGVR